jgi:hypothetical protein
MELAYKVWRSKTKTWEQMMDVVVKFATKLEGRIVSISHSVDAKDEGVIILTYYK